MYVRRLLTPAILLLLLFAVSCTSAVPDTGSEQVAPLGQPNSSGSTSSTNNSTPVNTPSSSDTTPSNGEMGGKLWMNPAKQSVSGGQHANIIAQLDNVHDVQGVQLRVSFDATVLAAVDDDPAVEWIQIKPGVCPKGLPLVNTADNVKGEVVFAESQYGTPPCAAGQVPLFSIEFECLRPGSSDITFVVGTPLDTVIATPQGEDVTPTTIINGVIDCQ